MGFFKTSDVEELVLYDLGGLLSYRVSNSRVLRLPYKPKVVTVERGWWINRIGIKDVDTVPDC